MFLIHLTQTLPLSPRYILSDTKSYLANVHKKYKAKLQSINDTSGRCREGIFDLNFRHLTGLRIVHITGEIASLITHYSNNCNNANIIINVSTGISCLEQVDFLDGYVTFHSNLLPDVQEPRQVICQPNHSKQTKTCSASKI